MIKCGGDVFGNCLFPILVVKMIGLFHYHTGEM